MKKLTLAFASLHGKQEPKSLSIVTCRHEASRKTDFADTPRLANREARVHLRVALLFSGLRARSAEPQ